MSGKNIAIILLACMGIVILVVGGLIAFSSSTEKTTAPLVIADQPTTSTPTPTAYVHEPAPASPAPVTSTPIQPSSSPSHTSRPAAWHKVVRFDGETQRKTELFTVGSEWFVAWDTTPGKYGDMNFIVTIRDSSGDMVGSVANVIGAGNDKSYQHNKPGTYYLDINTAQPYAIEVWSQ